MPVVFDYEFADTKKGRLDSAKLSKTNMTANALAFLNTVSNAGYDACIYASENFLGEHLYANQISSPLRFGLQITAQRQIIRAIMNFGSIPPKAE